MTWLMQGQWSPYIAGIGIGLLNCLAMLVSNKSLGCSTFFARTSGMIERLFRGNKVMEKAYYKKVTPTVEWDWTLVLGVFFGAFLSSVLSGQFQIQFVPSFWAAAFGNSVTLRWIMAIIGGALMGFGARWAGGCTSGHAIAGAPQLSVSSWLATVCFFIGGVATAMLLFY